MDYESFYQTLIEVYNAQSTSQVPDRDWQPFFAKAGEILTESLQRFPEEEWEGIIRAKPCTPFVGGMDCCGTELTVPYLYWSDYVWQKLETSTYEENLVILNNLPCLTCRDHAQEYIFEDHIDLVGMKNSI